MIPFLTWFLFFFLIHVSDDRIVRIAVLALKSTGFNAGSQKIPQEIYGLS